jgi:hypothetical protein
MIGPIARAIDWSGLQLDYLVQSPLDESNPRLQEAIAFLSGPDFIPPDSQPAQFALDDSQNFHFPTPRPSAFTENNTVYGQLYRCESHWQQRPTVVLLHGGLMQGN